MASLGSACARPRPIRSARKQPRLTATHSPRSQERARQTPENTPPRRAGQPGPPTPTYCAQCSRGGRSSGVRGGLGWCRYRSVRPFPPGSLTRPPGGEAGLWPIGQRPPAFTPGSNLPYAPAHFWAQWSGGPPSSVGSFGCGFLFGVCRFVPVPSRRGVRDEVAGWRLFGRRGGQPRRHRRKNDHPRIPHFNHPLTAG